MTENNEMTIGMNGHEYNDFLRCLTNLKDVCNDVDIRNGIIRQRSNDLTSIFEIDLNPIIPGGVSFALTDLKRKLDLLKSFAGQEVSLDIISGTGGYFSFADTYSKLKFISPSMDYIDNKFIEEDELERMFNLSEDDLILEHSIPGILTERIRNITQIFNTDAIQVTFDGESASIKSATQAKDQFADFINDIMTNMVLENCSALLPTIPFGIEHDNEIQFKMYKDPNNDISFNNFETTLGDIKVRILTRSSIVADED